MDTPLHFLLVEDDDSHAELIRLAFEESDTPHTLDRVSRGEDALSYLRKEGEVDHSRQPDVVLLDLKLTGMDGHEVLATMKEDETLRQIPVVVLSTSDAYFDKIKAYHHHVNSYLVKPVETDAFNALVREVTSYWASANRAASV